MVTCHLIIEKKESRVMHCIKRGTPENIRDEIDHTVDHEPFIRNHLAIKTHLEVLERDVLAQSLNSKPSTLKPKP